MSFIDRLFPPGELEALGNMWSEPATKRRKLGLDTGQGQSRVQVPPRRQNSESALGQNKRRHRFSTSSLRYDTITAVSSLNDVERSHSESKPSTTPGAQTVHTTTQSRTTNKSCLPSFIEPTILKNYLKHIHPNDRSRYSLPNSPNPDSQLRQPVRATTSHQEIEDNASSPGSLTADNSSPSSSEESCPTPAPGIYEQLRSGPWSHLLEGMRITDHERDMMEDLLSPGSSSDFVEKETSSAKPIVKAGEISDADETAAEDFYAIDEGLLEKMFPSSAAPPFGDRIPSHFNFGGYEYYPRGLPTKSITDREAAEDVHSSGLSPAPNEDEEEETNHKTPGGIVIYDYSDLSVDDFFDLDEASSASALNVA
ncbi:uncharacterized protein Z518_05378 [Rhinocladiella mackenziei CBS 650.93]|uniref:Uncharacterized protein n=1 Tax=Rhinocladiella mackenziei CBS 650.93 TaxID=1442369 RepID=A0A0D2H298_9EURO|nr:uncharacterized protein Z518_05378 [Rhinocladiella mackenziei CBS 650.93]KIX04508.1 hypothetical protein Z518_05378 [Rhinocladiella mackenziei CBS 650.93]